MQESLRGFGSDNHSGVHPRILENLLLVNQGHAPSYGTDHTTEKAVKKIKELFGEKADAYFVFNGTAANILCLRALTNTTEAVVCSDVAHIHVDECAGPEALAHVKLLPIQSQNGKLSLSEIKKIFIRRGDQHFAQVKVVSLTQPTELGTVYSIAEVREIVEWAKSQGVYVHIDGARLANACVRLNVSFKEMTVDLGVDMVSFGGTKNGLMGGEVVINLNPKIQAPIKYMRKQMAQLPSKTRFISSQFLTYWGDGSSSFPLWKEIARHSCEMAQYLYKRVSQIHGVVVTHPVESNAVFARIPQRWIKPLREKYFFYVWDEATFECRWMTSWDTQKEDVDGFAQLLQTLSHDQ